MNWMTLVFFVGLLWIFHVSSKNCNQCTKVKCEKLTTCLTTTTDYLFVADNFSGVIDAGQYWNHRKNGCIIFLQENATGRPMWSEQSPQLQTKNGAYVLQILKGKINNKRRLYILQGKKCNVTVSGLTDSTCIFNQNVTGPCQVRCLDTETICKQSTYDEQKCTNMGGNGVDEYFIKITAPEENCLNCVKPVRGPDIRLDTEKLKDLNITVTIQAGKPVDATQAAKMMDNMANLAATINVSSAELNVGEGVTGILKRETDPTSIDNVFFAYKSPNDSISIIDNTDTMATFSRSVTVPKEAFEKSFSSNVSVVFAVLMRFTNLAKDAKNSMVLGNEVLAVEMGANITNLTDKININFQNLTYKGIPSCQSWDGQGSRPNWTSDGCLTIQNGENITCQCSHLTFLLS
ncbi:uncharacterized protein LOC119909480 [Micropterus salmoides]|uniref:uncharacterized protein LOC119909480 n=1 Tax=Micropterus salmoides TaxID=27706 RepID=UPI0018EC0F15|nr:uncharacterized protein LOC119909480 [Micropterus salmoides]